MCPPKIDIRYHCFCSVLLLGTLFNHAEEKLWLRCNFLPFSETDTGNRLLQFSGHVAFTNFSFCFFAGTFVLHSSVLHEP